MWGLNNEYYKPIASYGHYYLTRNYYVLFTYYLFRNRVLSTPPIMLEKEVPIELKVFLTLTGTLMSLLKHTTEDPAPGCLSRRRIVKMIYLKL